MHFNVGFSDKKINENYFDVLLPIGAYYCKDYLNGNVYVFKEQNIGYEEIVHYLFQKRNPIINMGKLRFNKEMDALLCLLVNPYFDKFVEQLKNNRQYFSNKLMSIFKKQIFNYLASDLTYRTYQIGYMEGSKFYNEHSCYQKSNEILSLLN